jgi:hypothetical protein
MLKTDLFSDMHKVMDSKNFKDTFSKFAEKKIEKKSELDQIKDYILKCSSELDELGLENSAKDLLEVVDCLTSEAK